MGYEGEHAGLLAPIFVDLETAPLEDARAYVDPPDLENITAPKSYKKEEAIAEYIETAKAERLEAHEVALRDKAALDWNVARIVCVGAQTLDSDYVNTIVASNEEQERAALAAFWITAKRRQIVGFGIRAFDVPMMIQRSRYLGVQAPEIDLGRYARNSIVIDLFDLLTFNDARATSVMRRSLKSFCRRFGIDVSDDIDGAEIPRLVAAGDWDAVAAHCRADIHRIRQLALRIGAVSERWIPKPEMPSTAELVREIQARRAL